MRICMRTNFPVIKKEKDGKVFYETGSTTLDMIDTLDKLFRNNSYSSASNDQVCEGRLINNETDFTTQFYLATGNQTYFTVPMPDIGQKMSILAG